MSDKCPICNSSVSNAPGTFHSSASGVHGHTYSCPRCGDYRLESFASAQLRSRLDSDRKVAVLSHRIRNRHEAKASGELRGEEPVTLTDELVAGVTRQSLPSPAQQANKFILWLGNSGHRPGEPVPVHAATHQSTIGAITPRGFKLVLDHLLETGLLGAVASPDINGKAKINLSVKGWQRYEELRRGAIESRKAFMAMPYNEPELDAIVESVFREAVRQAGFELSILPDNPKAGLIDDRLRVEIRAARFLIADLTHRNPGAYWEAGYAEGLGRPVIYTCERKVFEDPQSKPHFDTNHHLTVLWDSEKPEEATKELKATIRPTLPAEAKLTDD